MGDESFGPGWSGAAGDGDAACTGALRRLLFGTPLSPFASLWMPLDLQLGNYTRASLSSSLCGLSTTDPTTKRQQGQSPGCADDLDACTDAPAPLDCRAAFSHSAGALYGLGVCVLSDDQRDGERARVRDALALAATDDECAPGCALSSVANGVCDGACFAEQCRFDGGDCVHGALALEEEGWSGGNVPATQDGRLPLATSLLVELASSSSQPDESTYCAPGCPPSKQFGQHTSMPAVAAALGDDELVAALVTPCPLECLTPQCRYASYQCTADNLPGWGDESESVDVDDSGWGEGDGGEEEELGPTSGGTAGGSEADDGGPLAANAPSSETLSPVSLALGTILGISFGLVCILALGVSYWCGKRDWLATCLGLSGGAGGRGDHFGGDRASRGSRGTGSWEGEADGDWGDVGLTGVPRWSGESCVSTDSSAGRPGSSNGGGGAVSSSSKMSGSSGAHRAAAAVAAGGGGGGGNARDRRASTDHSPQNLPALSAFGPPHSAAVSRSPSNYVVLPLAPSQGSSDHAGGRARPSTTSSPHTTVSSTSPPSSLAHSQVLDQPQSTSRFWIDVSELSFGRVLGAGHFGTVTKGSFRGAPVAIKEVRERERRADEHDGQQGLLAEAQRMFNLRPHLHVLQLYGVSRLRSGCLAIVTEYCPLGDLATLLYGQQLLHSGGGGGDDENDDDSDDSDDSAQSGSSSGSSSGPPSPRFITHNDTAHLALGIARGLYHLHYEGITHRDLAARNIFVADGTPLVAKVGDFGLARPATGHTASNSLPLRWMPPEAFRRQYGPFVDVWSFGVVLFELYGRAPPWLGYKGTEVAARVMAGETLAIPPSTPEPVAALMRDCWAFDALSRPQAGTLVRVLEGVVREEGRTARRARRRKARSPATSDPASTNSSGSNASTAAPLTEGGGVVAHAGYSSEMVNPYEGSASYVT